MYRGVQLVIVEILTLALLAGAGPVLAQGDPTPTLANPFITPTPWARPTPTLWQDPGGPDLAANFAVSAGNAADMADNIINGYNWLNQSGAVSTGIFFFMSMLVIGLTTRVFKRSKEL